MAWYIGQSLLMMAIAFLTGLLAGYLLWGRRYRWLEQAEAVRAVDPATVLPHRSAGSGAASGASGAAARAVQGAAVAVAEQPADPGQQADDEEPTAQPTAVAAPEREPADEPVVEAGPVAAVGNDGDDQVKAEPPTAAEIVAAAEAAGETEPDTAPETVHETVPESEAQSLFAAAGQPEPVAVTAAAGTTSSTPSDRLEQVEGIGPKIALALRTAGIRTFADLADTDETTLRNALADANLRFAPSLSTWAQQARLLADGDLEGHSALTEQLVAGRSVPKERG